MEELRSLLGNNHWFVTILIGLVVGVLARFFVSGRHRMGIILTTLLGIAGAVVAGLVGQYMGWYGPGQSAGFFASLFGAIAILALVGLFRGR
ncbi:putative membrane protein YeaQ/YmgE (transglycosylase-associated protein family) [Luteimonas cucumeris]|uniref:Putative membrane protein YeaQ/YmgE (Transglycosylase-associated protein family) n=1 Tax=Luteimonas cucumeris TaxID=985012 RepID=A0A562KY89_9GAMM|nr:putative membrane protein YeaQ/YmgE (transglycosylase-associated protein family) [Luteimonas cucumeris]